jgi:arabinan endo-1,5-alpha-L-arabinosidase
LETAAGVPISVMLTSRGKWFAPGHNSIIQDSAGKDWILYHAVDSGRPRTKPTDEVNTRRIMLIDRIEWRDGWPRVAGDGPSTQPVPAPRTGR